MFCFQHLGLLENEHHKILLQWTALLVKRNKTFPNVGIMGGGLLLLLLPLKCILHGMKINHTAVGARTAQYLVQSTNQECKYIQWVLIKRCHDDSSSWLPLCSRQRPPWTSPPQVFTSVHLLKKFVGSRFTINSPRFQNNWVKIHRRKKWDRSRFTKVKFLLRPRFTSLPKKLASYLAKISA